MKIFTVICALLFSLTVYAQNISVKNGWQLLGAVEDINVSEFDNTCVDFIWKYDTSDTANPQWKLHIANGVNYTHSSALMSQLTTNDGFWLKAHGACSVITTQQCPTGSYDLTGTWENIQSNSQCATDARSITTLSYNGTQYTYFSDGTEINYFDSASTCSIGTKSTSDSSSGTLPPTGKCLSQSQYEAIAITPNTDDNFTLTQYTADKIIATNPLGTVKTQTKISDMTTYILQESEITGYILVTSNSTTTFTSNTEFKNVKPDGLTTLGTWKIVDGAIEIQYSDTSLPEYWSFATKPVNGTILTRTKEGEIALSGIVLSFTEGALYAGKTFYLPGKDYLNPILSKITVNSTATFGVFDLIIGPQQHSEGNITVVENNMTLGNVYLLEYLGQTTDYISIREHNEDNSTFDARWYYDQTKATQYLEDTFATVEGTVSYEGNSYNLIATSSYMSSSSNGVRIDLGTSYVHSDKAGSLEFTTTYTNNLDFKNALINNVPLLISNANVVFYPSDANASNITITGSLKLTWLNNSDRFTIEQNDANLTLNGNPLSFTPTTVLWTERSK